MDLRTRALEAFADEDFAEAASLYSQALKTTPDNADLLVKRAQCYLKLNKALEAVADVKRASELEPTSHRAFLAKGEALLELEEYETAQEAIQKAQSLGGPAKKCEQLLQKCRAELSEEAGASQSQQQTSVSNAAQPLTADLKDLPSASTITDPTAPSPSSPAPASNGTSEPKYRHQFFQTQLKVEVAVLAKNLTAERVKVDIGESNLLVVITQTSGGEENLNAQEYRLDIKLAGKIDPSKSRHEILKTKLEIALHKADLQQWPQLEARDGQAIVQASSLHSQPGSVGQPYAFRGREIDWNKLEAEVKQEEKDEKLDGDAGLQKFFQGLYAGSDEDTRRAMNKSFQESNGTVLSTDWKDIGSKKIKEYSSEDKDKYSGGGRKLRK